jgi:hypothetical protein
MMAISFMLLPLVMPIGRMISVIVMIIRPAIASESELEDRWRDDHGCGRTNRGRFRVGFLRRLNVHRRRSDHH